MSRIGTIFRTIRAALSQGQNRLIPMPILRVDRKDPEGTQPGAIPTKVTRRRKPVRKNRITTLIVIFAVITALSVLVWVFWPKKIHPPVNPGVKRGWEGVILAKVKKYETVRLDSLIRGDLEVEALFDNIIRRETKIYWQVSEGEDWQGPTTLGAPSIAYNQLAAVHGYAKQEAANDMHVDIHDFRLGSKRHELESITLQLKIQ